MEGVDIEVFAEMTVGEFLRKVPECQRPGIERSVETFCNLGRAARLERLLEEIARLSSQPGRGLI